jgi:MFS family permease
VLVGLGLFIRLKITETPDFELVKQTQTVARVPIIAVLRTNLKQVLLAAGANFLLNGSFYVFVTFIITYGRDALGMPTSIFLNATLVGATVMFLTIPLAGALSDRFGRLPIYLAGAAFLGVMAFPIFWLIDSKMPFLITLAISLALFGLGLIAGPQAAFFNELFGANVRYSGASLGYQGVAIFAGGLAPFIATWLLHQFSFASWPIALYLIAMALITLISASLAGETRTVTQHQPSKGETTGWEKAHSGLKRSWPALSGPLS